MNLGPVWLVMSFQKKDGLWIFSSTSLFVVSYEVLKNWEVDFVNEIMHFHSWFPAWNLVFSKLEEGL